MSLAFERSAARPGAPVLVLVHGLGSSSTVWRPVLPLLEPDFDVIRVDLPGHGDSPSLAPGADASPAGLAASVAATLLAVLDPPAGPTPWPVHVAGSSLGGWVGLELAALTGRRQTVRPLPFRVRSVTAFAPAGLWEPGIVPLVAHLNRWAARLTAPMAPALLRSRPLRALGFWTASARPADLDPQVALDAARAHAGARGWAAALAAASRGRFDPAGFPDDVAVTVVWGDRDRILPPERCQELGSAPAQARWVRLDDCGHVPMWDRPEESVALIRQTVARARLGRGPQSAPATTRRAAARG
jgi:pimeloyl-ACP methyl ester carboxylesterase